jgi:hypothetical protein
MKKRESVFKMPGITYNDAIIHSDDMHSYNMYIIYGFLIPTVATKVGAMNLQCSCLHVF